MNTPNVPICVAGLASHDLTKADQNGGYRTWVPSRPSQQVTVIAVTGQTVVRDCAGHGDAGEDSVMAAKVAAVFIKHRALPSRAHGALPLPAPWRGREQRLPSVARRAPRGTVSLHDGSGCAPRFARQA